MTIAEVRLYSYGLDRARGDIPIFATATAEAAAGAGSGVTTPTLTFSSVKVRRDPYPQNIQVSIDASSMSSLELCDTAVIRIGTIDRWYWITGYEEITNSTYPNASVNRMNVQISLEYIPVTTGLSLASKIDILPERMPTFTARVTQNWTQSVMLPATPTTSLPALPKIPDHNVGTSSYGPYKTGTLWCEISFTINSQVKRYGIFIPKKFNSRSSYKDRVAAGSYNSLSNGYLVYPSLAQIMNDPITYLGITGATINNVSISEFCPFQTGTGTTEVANEEYVWLKMNNGSITTPVVRYTAPGTPSTKYLAYDLTNYYLDREYFAGENEIAINQGTLTISLSDFEKTNGQITVKDSMRNDVMLYTSELLDNSMTFNYRVYSDTSNIYLVLEYNNAQITLPGYIIPWSTSTWDYYRAFNLQYDRQALQNNIEAANREMNISLIDAASTGVIGGLLAGALTGGAAGAGIGLATGVSSLIGGGINSNMRREENIRKMTREQELTEQRMRSGPTTLNNTSAGFGAINMINQFGGASFLFKAPDGFSSSEFSDQVAMWGYPSNKVKQTSVTLTAGYWKGRVTAFSSTMNNTSAGELNNMIVEQFDNGLRLKQVS